MALDVELGTVYFKSDKLPRCNFSQFNDVDARSKEIKAICELCRRGDLDGLRALRDRNGPQAYGNFAPGLFSGHKSMEDNTFFDGTGEVDGNVLNMHSPLRTAAEFGRLEVLKFLVEEQNVDVNEGRKKKENSEIYKPPIRRVNTTALHLAAASGHADSVTFLLEKDAAASLLDGHGDSAMHCAARYHKSTCIYVIDIDGEKKHVCALSVLIDKALETVDGESLHRLNAEGNRPLHVCARWDDCSGLELLLSAEEKLALAEVEKNLIKPSGVEPGRLSKNQDSPDKAACKAKLKALNTRNRDGHTATHIAALHNNKAAEQFLLGEGATWKEGMLRTSDRKHSLKAFAVLAVFFIMVITPIILSEMQRTKQGEELAQVCLKLGYPYNGREYWYCRCGAFAYYGGNVLMPNVFIICGVFFFKLLQFLFEKQLVPACDFISFFSFHKHNDDSTSLTTSKGRWLAASKQTALGRECAACVFDQHHVMYKKAAHHDDSNLAKSNSLAKRTWFSRLKICGNPDEEESNLFGVFYLGLFSGEKKKEAQDILDDWRRSKYKSIHTASPNFSGSSFCLQPTYIFLYVQTLWTVVSVLAITMEISKSDEVWMRRKTSSIVPDAFLSYTNFYGQVVNSACTNTVFTLFKMAVFDQRFGQLCTAHRNLPTLFLRILWPVFILLPSVLLLPPFITHIIPGFFLFAWIFIPLLLVYLLLLRVWVLLRSDKEPGGVVDRVLTCLGKAVSYFMIDILRIEEWSEANKKDRYEEINPHPSLLQTYFFMFVLEIFARYVFILAFQLTFDFSTLFFLGHNDDSFSQSHYYASLLKSNSTTNNDNDPGGAYLNSVFRVFKWRSQSVCFLEQGLENTRWPLKFSFF